MHDIGVSSEVWQASSPFRTWLTGSPGGMALGRRAKLQGQTNCHPRARQLLRSFRHESPAAPPTEVVRCELSRDSSFGQSCTLSQRSTVIRRQRPGRNGRMALPGLGAAAKFAPLAPAQTEIRPWLEPIQSTTAPESHLTSSGSKPPKPRLGARKVYCFRYPII